jgi:copper chaperone CopZ
MNSKKIYVILCLVVSTGFLNAQENTSPNDLNQIAVISIKGMACQEGCSDKIAENLKSTTGVYSAAVSFETGIAQILFDPRQVNIDSVEKVIKTTKVKDYVYTIDEVIIKNEIVE